MCSDTSSQGRPGSLLKTTDHKRLARHHLLLALGALLLGLHYALLIHLELWDSNLDSLGGTDSDQLVSAHGLVMVFLFALPVLANVVGVFVLPLAIGTTEVAAPQFNRFTLQLNIVAWLLFVGALLSGSIGSAWDAPQLQAGLALAPAILLALGLHIIGIGLVCTAINLLATVILKRAPGVEWSRLPVVVWGLICGAALQIVVGIAVGVLGLVLLLAATSAQILTVDTSMVPLLMQFVLYVGAAMVALMASGVVLEVVATFGRKAPAGGIANAFAMAALALLAFAGGAVALTAGINPLAADAAGSGLGLLLLVPAVILAYNLLATLHGGAIRISTPLLYAISCSLILVLGGLSGLFLVVLSTAAPLQGTAFATAQQHLLMGGGSLTGLCTALYYWWPKLFGRRTSETLGRFGALLLFAGLLLTFLPRLFSGAQGLSIRVVFLPEVYSATEIWSGLGGLLLALALAVVIWDLVASLRGTAKSGGNPWGGSTREWVDESGEGRRLSNPPYNFASLHYDAIADTYLLADEPTTER